MALQPRYWRYARGTHTIGIALTNMEIGGQ